MNSNYIDRDNIINERVIYADVLRILAVFAMVVLHRAGADLHIVPLFSYEWHMLNFYDSIVRWCVPVLFMLSGMFFLDVGKALSIAKLYKKHILRIFISLCFWGIIYGVLILVLKITRHESILSVHTILKIPLKILFGVPRYHLWFLYAIIGMYIITPFIRLAIKSAVRKDLEYILFAFVIFGSVVPVLNELLSFIDTDIKINFTITELMGWFGYYIAGYYFSHYDISIRCRKIVYCLGVFGLLFTIIATIVSSFLMKEMCDIFYNYLSPNVLFASFALFIFCKKHFAEIHLHKNFCFCINRISSYTYGIYLVHDLINQSLYFIGLNTLTFNPVFWVLVMSFITFVISFVLVFIIKKIPVLGKIIV